MKKIAAAVLTAAMILTFAIGVFAATPAVKITGDTSVKEGSNITLTASVSGTDKATSLAVSLTYDKEVFQFVSGEMLKTNGMSKFDDSTEKGSFALTNGEGDLNGNAAKVTFKALKAGASAQKIGITVIVKNGATELMNKTAEQSISITCATHSFGAWSKKSDTEHTRTCSACGKTETAKHTWDKGTDIETATCTKTGSKSYTCADCGATKTETVKKVPHTYGEWTEVTKATCTAKGSKTRICDVCKQEDTQEIAALGHDFENPTVVKEATIYSTGLTEGKCKRCGETAKQVIPCTFKDENNGVLITADEGAFAVGTEIKVESGSMSGAPSGAKVLRIYAVLNGKIVQPSKPVTLTLDIKDGESVFTADENGQVKKSDAETENGKAVMKVTSLGQYAIGTEQKVPSDDPKKTGENENNNGNTYKGNTSSKKTVIIVIAAIVVIDAILVTAFILKKRK